MEEEKHIFCLGFLYLIPKATCHFWPQRGTQGRTTKCQKSELFCETTWLLENLISYGRIVGKVNNTKSNILSVANFHHIPLIWFNLYIFQFRNRFRQNHKSYPISTAFGQILLIFYFFGNSWTFHLSHQANKLVNR